MLAVNYTSLRQDLKAYCDKANDDFETIIVTRKNGGMVITHEFLITYQSSWVI